MEKKVFLFYDVYKFLIRKVDEDKILFNNR